MTQIGVAIILLLQELLAAAKSDPFKTQRPVDEYLPTPAKLGASMPNAASREAKITAYLNTIKPRYEQAVTAGLLTRLDQARTLHRTMKSNDPAVTKPVRNLPKNDVQFFYDKLVLDNQSAEVGTIVGRDLLTGAATPSAHGSSKNRAIAAIMSLRHVDDVLARVLAAQRAATALGVQLREVMAMYRTEGDLAAPASAGSLGLDTTPPSLEIPPGIKSAPSFLNRGWAGWVDVSHLVAIRNNDLPSRTDEHWRLIGLLAWCVQIGGLDVFGEAGQYHDPVNGVVDTLIKLQTLSSANRTRAALPKATVPDASTRFTDALANIVVVKKTSRGKEVVIMAPRDPIALVDFVLQEAIAHQRALASFKNDPTGTAPFDLNLDPTLSYLRYHQTSNFNAYLVRAALAAKQIGGLQYLELRRELQQDVELQAKFVQLDAVNRTSNTATATPILNGGWPTVVNWFNTAPVSSPTGRFELLANFLKTADASVWNSWKDGRGNMSRYAVLLDYYGRLFP